MLICPNCGQENPEGFRFCGACASTLNEQAPVQREERKVVTVLFADLVGFTAAAERMDPEEVRALLAPYHTHLRAELERFGGTVEKFIGDAVMALFGAPRAHEDDPERAVRAALAIRDWAAEQEGPQVRIAVNTGEALITLGSQPGRGEAMAAGDVVNTAARLQAAAPLNGILVGEHTYRATQEAVEYRAADAVDAKGKAEPIPVWEALQPRARVESFEETRTPLVGRARELELLVSTLARAREERASQLVTLVGVPGIGKSRLVYELRQVVELEPELITWRQGRSLPYGDGVSFWALGEMVKQQAGILESDSREQAAEKLGRAVRARLDEDADWIEAQLRPLVGLSAEQVATSERGEAATAWRRFFEALAEQRPTVLVLEDLHWADDGLLDFIDDLVDRASGVPLLVLGTARPELLERRPGWGGGKPNALMLSLPPLADDESARLVASLLDRPLVVAETQRELLGRIGGNPLYAEQYARVLVERGALEEPSETVQGIIAARLDTLSDDEKRLLQDAAVVGTAFWVGAVQAIDGFTRSRAEELLRRLERKEFVQRPRRSSVGARPNTRFDTSSCVTGLTGRSRARAGPRSTAGRRRGSNRSVASRIMPRCSPTTTRERLHTARFSASTTLTSRSARASPCERQAIVRCRLRPTRPQAASTLRLSTRGLHTTRIGFGFSSRRAARVTRPTAAVPICSRRASKSFGRAETSRAPPRSQSSSLATSGSVATAIRRMAISIGRLSSPKIGASPGRERTPSLSGLGTT